MDNFNFNYRVVPKNNILNPSECCACLKISRLRSIQKKYTQSLGVLRLLEYFTPSFNPKEVYSILGVLRLLENITPLFNPKEVYSILGVLRLLENFTPSFNPKEVYSILGVLCLLGYFMLPFRNILNPTDSGTCLKISCFRSHLCMPPLNQQ
jgi:hypothetical protein